MKRICLIGSGNVAEAFAVAFRRTASRRKIPPRTDLRPEPGPRSETCPDGGMRPYGRSGTACPGRYLLDFGQRHTNRGNSGKPRFRQRHCRAHSRERLAERLARPLVPPGCFYPLQTFTAGEADRFPAGSAADRRGNIRTRPRHCAYLPQNYPIRYTKFRNSSARNSTWPRFSHATLPTTCMRSHKSCSPKRAYRRS